MEAQGIGAPFCYAGNATYASCILRAFKHGLSIVYLSREIHCSVVQVSSLRGLRRGFCFHSICIFDIFPLKLFFH